MTSTRRGAVTIVRQTIANDKVVAVTVQVVKRNITTKKDGIDYVLVNGKQCMLIKGVVLV